MRVAGEACGSSKVCPAASHKQNLPPSGETGLQLPAEELKHAQQGGAERVLARNTEKNKPSAPSEAASTDTTEMQSSAGST